MSSAKQMWEAQRLERIAAAKRENDAREAAWEALGPLDQQDAREAHYQEQVLAGNVAGDCNTCREVFIPFLLSKWKPGAGWPFAPPHKASAACRSGKYAHCTCGVCF